MVGLQIEGSWVLPLLRVDLWRKDGHSFHFSVPPEGESVEIKSQSLPLKWHVQDTCSWGQLELYCLWKEREKLGTEKSDVYYY